MGRSVTPAGGGLPASPSGRALTRRGPGSLGYESTDAAGFEVVPVQVRQTLTSAALIGPEALSASSDRPTVRRRGDATFYQLGRAWWGDERALLTFQYQREMQRVSGTQFRPASGWRVDGTLSRLGSIGGSEQSVWHFDPLGANPAPPRTSTTDDPLDILPAEVTRPVREGTADAWRLHRKGWASETVVAMRTSPGRALLLRAVREATSLRGLPLADWLITTLEAPIIETLPVHIVVGGQPVVRSRGPNPLPE